MSHSVDTVTLPELREICLDTGECSQYQTQLQQEKNEIDSYMAGSNQTVISWGIFAGLIGLVILLTPLISPLRKLQVFLLPVLASLGIIIAGLALGLFVGFGISFGACFKEDCSIIASSAMFTIPAASLIFTIPMAIKLYKRRHKLTAAITNINRRKWLISGALIIVASIAITSFSVYMNNADAERFKDHLEQTTQP